MKFFVVALVSACVLSAQTGADTGADKGKQLIDKAVAALGGDRFLQLQNVVTSGRIYNFFRGNLNALETAKTYIEFLDTKPAGGLGLQEREFFGKKQDYSLLFLPNQAWDITYRGARPITEENWAQYRRSTENNVLFMLRTRHNESGLQFDYVGTDVWLSTHVEILDITDAKNQTVRVYFDHNTMLPIRETFNWVDPETRYRDDEVIEFSKYRDVGGITWPYTTYRERNGYKVYEGYSDKVEVNQPLPPKTFELPPGAKVLKKVD
jgi:hypothetical protein